MRGPTNVTRGSMARKLEKTMNESPLTLPVLRKEAVDIRAKGQILKQ